MFFPIVWLSSASLLLLASGLCLRYLMPFQDSAKPGGEKLPFKLNGASIPDRSPGHAFIVKTRSGNNGELGERACRDSPAGSPSVLGGGQAPALQFSPSPIGCPSWAGSRWHRAPVPNLFSYQASQSGNASISSSRFGADDAAIILSGQERTDEFDDSHHHI